MQTNSTLAIITEGYRHFAQMSLSTANLLGHLRNPFFRFVTANEDGIYYIIEPRILDNGQFEFSDWMERKPIVVDSDYMVLLYVCLEPAPQSDEEQIDALWNFAMQYPPNTLIRKFICEDVIAWLERNKETPSLFSEYLRMKIAANRLEDSMNDLDEIYG
jgi:hypothetical protein